MAAVDVRQPCGRRLEFGEEARHEAVRPVVVAQELVQPGSDLRKCGPRRDLGPQQRPERRHDERRRYALASDVGEEPEAFEVIVFERLAAVALEVQGADRPLPDRDRDRDLGELDTRPTT